MAEGATGAGDKRFFARTGPYGLAAVAAAAGASVSGGPADLSLSGVAPLGSAGPDQVSFLDNKRYLDALAATRAGAVIVHPDMAPRVPPGTVALITTNPYAGWAKAAALFYPVPPVRPGIHALAAVAPDAKVDPSAEIGPFVSIGEGAEIGPGCRLAPGVVIGPGVQMGRDCRIGANASISHAVLGARVSLLPGARVGQEGYGFAQTPEGFVSVPQLGMVILEDDVEIGANATVDRGSAQDTVIGAGTRLDNLVQIGHNVRLGRCCVVVALAGISGSTTVEDFVVLAAQAGVAGHLTIGKGAKIGAQAGVMASVEPGAELIGSPAEPLRDFFRGVATLRKLARRPKNGSNESPD